MAIRKKITKSRFCRPQLTILNILRQDFFNTRCYEIFYMMDILSCLLATRTASLERNHLTVSVWRICRQLKEITKGDIHYYYGQQFPRAFSPANVDQLPPPFWLLPSACQLPLSSVVLVLQVWSLLSRWFITSKRLALINFWLGQKGKQQKDASWLRCLLSLVLLKLHQIQSAKAATPVEDLMVDPYWVQCLFSLHDYEMKWNSLLFIKVHSG